MLLFSFPLVLNNLIYFYKECDELRIEIANNCTVTKHWEQCYLCTAIGTEKLCVIHALLPTKELSDFALIARAAI